MARYIDITTSGGTVSGVNVEGMLFHVQLANPVAALGGVGPKMFGRKSWRLLRPTPRGAARLCGQGSGYYEETFAGFLQLYSDDGGLLFELRGLEDAHGPAFAAPSGARFQVGGTWRAGLTELPGTYYGLMFKGGGAAGVGGEFSIAALARAGALGHGCSLGAGGWRLGLAAGGSAGLAFVMATGFPSVADFKNYTSSGLDWALSFGPKWSGILKDSGKLMPVLGKMEEVLETLEGAARMRRLESTVKDSSRELYSVAKSIQARALIDDEYQGIVAFDIPLFGGGAEAGIYYASSKFALLSDW